MTPSPISTSPHGTAMLTKSTNHGVSPIATNRPATGLPFAGGAFCR
jgi:hypothetical protein